jgi:hypothetical protein
VEKWVGGEAKKGKKSSYLNFKNKIKGEKLEFFFLNK